MKRTLLLCLLLAYLSPFVYGQKAMPVNDMLKTAQKTSIAEKKKIFVIFHSSWCGWCKTMDKKMNDASVKKYFDENYVVIHFTVDENDANKYLENPGADSLRMQTGGAMQGIPYWVILNDSLQVLADSRRKDQGGKLENVGCPSSPEEITYFIEVLNKTSGINKEGINKIAAVFKK